MLYNPKQTKTIAIALKILKILLLLRNTRLRYFLLFFMYVCDVYLCNKISEKDLTNTLSYPV